MDEFSAPEGPGLDAADLDAAGRAPLVLKVAGVVCSVAGAFVATAGTQLFTFFTLTSMQTVTAAGLVLLGVVAVVLGPLTLKGRATAAIAATGVCGLMALLSVSWLVYAVVSGVLSPMLFLAAGSAPLAAVLAPLAIGPASRMTAARNALYA
ncbi:MAG: hypothetical protein KTR31_40085 [Myxococcales bacterium]|nr:hypothetical protein [Myxococcales bacterium]